MRRIILVLVLALSGCSAVTPQTASTAITVAHDILSYAAEVLARADLAMKDCAIDLNATHECAELNDAIIYVESRLNEYRHAVEQRDQDNVWEAEQELEWSVQELWLVIEEMEYDR